MEVALRDRRAGDSRRVPAVRPGGTRLLEPLSPVLSRPLLLLAPAVTISAWYGGLGPGLLCLVLGEVAVVYFFMPPFHRLAIPEPRRLERLLMFLLEGVLLSYVCEALHRARRKAEATAAALAQEMEERRKLEGALRQRAEALARADGAKDQFLAMLASAQGAPGCATRSPRSATPSSCSSRWRSPSHAFAAPRRSSTGKCATRRG
jgi:hypothetical protein